MSPLRWGSGDGSAEEWWRAMMEKGPRLRLGRSWHSFSRRDHLSTVYTPQPHSPIGLMPKAP